MPGRSRGGGHRIIYFTKLIQSMRIARFGCPGMCKNRCGQGLSQEMEASTHDSYDAETHQFAPEETLPI